MNDCTIIIFGATGDLTKRKLIPALYRLIHAQKMEKLLIIGAARDDINADEILKRAEPFMDQQDDKTSKLFKNQFFYETVHFNQEKDFKKLQKKVIELEQKFNMSGNRILYCATASSFYCTITHHIATSGLAEKKSKKDTMWHRIVYEKPFGHDLASAQEINKCIGQYFDEEQIYRIDHYLMKEIVANIALVRFTNCVLEPLWNNRYIDAVQIILSETIGLEGRGGYYDHYGAVRDVLQNHMLEILALIAMESPEWLTGEYIRTERAKVLSKVKVIDGLFGQYDSYQQEPSVAKNSATETFAAAFLRIDNPRWAGVPFYLKTGKCLQTKQTIIHIKFKQVDCLLTKHCPTESNYLSLEVSPDAIMALSLNVKKPGYHDQVLPVKMEFSHNKLLIASPTQAYEILFEEIFKGESSISVRFDEIESSWAIVDQLRALKPPLYTYKKGTSGPTEMKKWENKHGMRWLS